MKQVLRKLINAVGYDLVPFSKRPATSNRYPYADLKSFLEDIRERGFEIRTMIDVGANTGSWSQRVSAVYPGVNSVLVEPQKELIPQLEAICQHHPGWQVANVGLAGVEGTRPFLVFEDTFSSRFLSSDSAESQSNRDVREVTVTTLDSLWHEYLSPTRPELVKLDAEGLELEIVEGGTETLNQTDMVVVETSLFEFRSGQPVVADVVAAMRQCGFSLYDIIWFLRRPSDHALGLMDCVFVSDRSSVRASNQW